MSRGGGVELDKGDVRKLYTVAQRVAEGNYGTVFKATSKKTGGVVAYKLIENIEKDDLVEVLREVAILRRLSHPNVIQLQGAYRREKTELVIITEFCDGGSLADLCARAQRAVPEPILKILMRDLLRGLAYLHEVNIMHRDIKAENILLTEGGQLKITDFGISAQLSSPSDRRKSFIGTPHWMAPEVISVTALFLPYGIPADIWSVGITCLELAEMQPPLWTLDATQALIEIPRKPPPSLAQPSQWSPDLPKFLARCLQRDPAQRATAAALLMDGWLGDAAGAREVAAYIRFTHDPAAMREALRQQQSAPPPRKATVSVMARRETRKLLWTHAQKLGATPASHASDVSKEAEYYVADEAAPSVAPAPTAVTAAPAQDSTKRGGGGSTRVNIGSARSPSPLPTRAPGSAPSSMRAPSPTPLRSAPNATETPPAGGLLPRPRLPPGDAPPMMKP